MSKEPSLREDIAGLIWRSQGFGESLTCESITLEQADEIDDADCIAFCHKYADLILGILTQRLEKCGLTDEAIKELCVRYLGWDEPVSDKDLALAKPLFEFQLQKVNEGLK